MKSHKKDVDLISNKKEILFSTGKMVHLPKGNKKVCQTNNLIWRLFLSKIPS